MNKMGRSIRIIPILFLVGILALVPLAGIACGGEDEADIAAKFEVSATTGVVPVEVDFTDQSSSKGTITSWEWDFGDGTTSTDQNPTHTYDKVGLYTVILKVSGDKGTATEAKSQYISATAVQYAKASLKLTYAMSTGQSESKSPELFADLVEKYTGGAVDVTVFGGGTLYTYGEDMTAVKNGAADIVWTSPFFLRQIKPWLDPLSGIPDLTVGLEHGRAVMANSQIQKIVGDALLGMGWYRLGYFESVLGGAYFNTDKETKDITDLNGLKVGSLYPGAMSPTMAWAGMSEVAVGGAGEVTALASGQYQVSATSWSHIISAGMTQYMKHALLTENFQVMVALMNPAKWNSLEPALKTLITDTILPEVQAFAKTTAIEEHKRDAAVIKKKFTTVNVQTPTRAKEIFDTLVAENYPAMTNRINAFKADPGNQVYDLVISLRPATPTMSQDFKDMLTFAGITIPS